MISNSKLPFDGASTGVETRSATPSDGPPETGPEMPGGRAAASQSARSEPPRDSAFHLWLRRIGVLLFVFLCATVGVMLMIVPWRPEWSENPLLLSYPTLHDVVASGFTRGLVTGLGLLNVWIGFWEALRYRED